MGKYDPDNSILYLAGKGDSSIKYFEIVDEAPYIHFLSEFRHSSAQKGIAWVPKHSLDTSKCEIARCLQLLRDSVQPVSFVVPRKSEMFQAGLYADGKRLHGRQEQGPPDEIHEARSGRGEEGSCFCGQEVSRRAPGRAQDCQRPHQGT